MREMIVIEAVKRNGKTFMRGQKMKYKNDKLLWKHTNNIAWLRKWASKEKMRDKKIISIAKNSFTRDANKESDRL